MTRVAFSIVLDTKTITTLEKIADKEGKRANQLIEELILKGLKEKQKAEKVNQ